MHTAAAYTNLTSLLLEKREALVGKSIALFSYGSGAASTMYCLKVRALCGGPHTRGMRAATRIKRLHPARDVLCYRFAAYP